MGTAAENWTGRLLGDTCTRFSQACPREGHTDDAVDVAGAARPPSAWLSCCTYPSRARGSHVLCVPTLAAARVSPFTVLLGAGQCFLAERMCLLSRDAGQGVTGSCSHQGASSMSGRVSPLSSGCGFIQ